MINIVLHEPEMPANTGNIGRTCVATGVRLHLIGPLGFQINDKMLKRAGLDYWDKLDVTEYDDYKDFLAKNPGAKVYMATTKAHKIYTEVNYEDDMFGKKSWEEAESHIQEMAVDKLLIKSGMAVSDIDYIYAGDLLGQLIATSFGLMKYEVPMFGLYGACSTMGEALSLGAMCVNAGYAQNVIAIASSHFASAEKQFRYPLEYGNQRPIASTWTVTGAGAYIVGDKPLDKKKCVLIKGITTGKIVDYGVKDSMNMGACMAPAAAELIEANFKDLDVDKNYYDAIFTGDLGEIGNRILSELLKEKGIDIADKLYDCGMLIYEGETKCSGGSGCGCSAVVLGSCIMDRLIRGEYKRVLFVPTGALLSTVSYNEGKSVPGIAHGVILEGKES